MASITGIERVYNLTSLQEGMLYHSVTEKDSQDYIVQTCMHVEGNLDTDLLEASIKLLSVKHDVLRTLIFYSKAARPRQVILKDRTVEVIHFDLAAEGTKRQTERLEEIRRADRDRGFALEKDSLLRITVVHIEGDAYEMIWTFHHIIMDGWCLSLLYGDFIQFYNQLEEGSNFDEMKAKILGDKKYVRRYEDYINWLEKQDKEKGLQYWSEVLRDYDNDALIARSTLRTVSEEPVSEEIYTFSKELSENIKSVSAKHGVTISNIMESAWGLLLQHYAGCNDVVFGKVVSGRNAEIAGIEQMVGLFINTIPERIKCTGEMTVEELWNETKTQAVESSRYDYCPLAEVQSLTDKGNYLIHTLYVYENYFVSDSAKQTAHGLTMSMSENHEKTNYDITLSVSMSECVQLSILYELSMYPREDIQRILRQLETIVTNMLADTSQKVSTLAYMTKEEEEQVRNAFNQSVCEVPKEKTAVQIYEEIVAERRQHIMLLLDGASLTYDEVNKRANRVAHTLRQQGVKPGDYVALLAQRSFEMIIGIFGIIKAGGAYVPIDPTYPKDRVCYILNDCKPKAVLIYQTETKDYEEFNLLDLEKSEIWSQEDENPERVNTPEDVMYVIYTSGTTGNPKGVMIRHRNLVNLVYSYSHLYDMNQNDTVLQFASIAFDQSVWDIFSIMLLGGTLCLVPYEYITDPRRMEQYITENKVTVMALTPAYIRELEPKNMPYLKAVESGGAAADLDILKKWYSHMKVFNTYGPTEVTVNAATYLLRGDELNSIPIGSPIHNCQAYILDKQDRLCGIGCPGELCLAGAGVSAGYLNRPELTAEKFVDNPFGTGKLYRTGDLAKWRFDGVIDYMGRIDEQIKIRGFRIELGEIESVLLKQKGIKDAAVIARKDQEGESFIAAYFVADQANWDIKMLAKELRKVLPNYMIPAYFEQIDQIPLTKNGKLNVKALPEPEMMGTSEYRAPKTETEKTIVQVFEEILLVKRVGMEDNFFELGGHSLRATRAVNMLKAQLECNVTVKDLFLYSTPAELAELIESRKNQGQKNYESIPLAEKKPFYPMSAAQKRLFMVHELDPQETVYNMPGVLELAGEFSLEHLNQILHIMGCRHGVFRTRFGYENGDPVQYIEDQVQIEAEYEEMPSADAKAKAQLMEAFVRPFDLGKAPLLRVKLVKTGEASNLLMFDMHHIICDGVSSSIIQEEFMTLFNQGTLDERNRQYVDYSQWMNSRDLSGQKQYWLEQFQDEVPVLDLPYDMTRPQYQSFRGKTIRKMLDKKLTDGVKKLAAKYEATEYMVYLAAYMILLSRYSRQQDIVVGSPVSGRTHQDTEHMVGMFVNMLPFRAKPDDTKLFSQFLLEVKETCLKGYENQDYPFEDLIEEIDVQRNAARNPVFDVVFVMQNTEQKKLSLDHVMELEQVKFESTVAKFDLTVTIDQMEDESAVTFEYCEDLFYQDSIISMMGHFLTLLEQLAERPDSSLETYEDTNSLEKQRLLETFNQTDATFPDKTVVELFEEQVARTPDQIAGVFCGEEITYRELNEKANVIARKLRQYKVGKGDYVMLMTDRSLELLIGICAVCKAGAAYVPVDPDYPKDRIEYMAGDCKPKAVLTTRELVLECLEGIPVWNLKKEDFKGNKENLEGVNDPEDGIYVIYTSGTTGRPKGVLISHRNVVRLFKNSRFAFDFGEQDVWMLFHYYGFDFSVWEIYGALLFGGKLLIPLKETVQNPKTLLRFITEQGLTVLNQVPSAFYALMDEMSVYRENKIRYLIFGGEALEPAKLLSWHKMYDKVKIINMYGITETCVHVTYREITEVEMERGISDIGNAIPTLKVYVMNGMRLCGIGVPGELCVAGEGVAKGYLNQPELTAQKFIPNPFGTGKLYRSGDLARWLPDGNLAYMGRIDQQVKVRGFRIELSEIANVIRNQDCVKDAVVVLKEVADREKYIMAYIISADGKPTDFKALKEAMQNELPNYMMPSGYLNIDEIPLTANGKLNRKALPEIDFSNLSEYVEPETDSEKLVAKIYKEVLSLEKVGANDNFFEIGGHSLKATRVLNLLETRTGIRLSLRDILLYPVVREFAVKLDESKKQEYEPIPKAEAKERYLVSVAQRRLYIIQKMSPQSTVYNMPAVMELHGQVDITRLREAFEKLVARHEILRTVFLEERDQIYQIVQQNENAAFEYEECQNASKEQKQRLYKQFIQPFSLEQGPLIRMKVVKLEEQDYMLLFDMHHIIADGMSLNLLIQEFMAFYHGEEIEENRIQYKDYSEWMNSRDLSGQKEYWLDRFKDEVPVLNLITDFKRPQVQDYRGEHILSTMSQELKKRTAQFAAKTGTTEFMVLFSAWTILLAEYGRTEDLVVGTPISGRIHPDIEKIPGMFVNTLALRTKPEGNLTYLEYLQKVKETCLGAFEHQEYPFDELAELICVNRDLSRNPVFDVMFTMQNQEQGNAWLEDVQVSGCLEEQERAAKFDLTMNVTPGDEGYQLELEYAAALFQKNSMAILMERFQAIVEEILDNPEKKLCTYTGRIPIDVKIEENTNQTKQDYDTDQTVADLFEDCVKQVPEHAAVWEQGKVLTYQQLNDRANKLANYLLRQGIQKGDRIALVSKRSTDLITAILAVIKSGGVYVPIDPEYPKARIQYMLEDCKPVMILTDQIEKMKTAGMPEIPVFEYACIDQLAENTENLSNDIHPEDLIYMIYTSGTTGKPKGVMIEHQGVVNLHSYFIREQNMTAEDKVLQFASMAFDAMVSELCMSIFTGAVLYLVGDEARRDSRKFEAFVLENEITAMVLPPQFLASCNLQGNIRTIITAGSETNRSLVLKNGSISRYSNDYGPTECTVCATHWEYQNGEELGERIPIGKPIGNKEVYVMNGMERCPVLVPGELCVAGAGIARGYWNQEALTREKFIANPFGSGMLYRTGDFVRMLPDGNLEFLGRIDEQVKIRGYRVELSEIENVLKRQEAVTDAVVLAKEDKNGEKFISAYLTGTETALEEIRMGIRKELPDYMMPSFFTFLESIPVTTNGKTDRKKLLALELETATVYEEPATPMEQLTADIFRDVLDREKVGATDNFFEIGGHSLRATRVINELESRTGKRMDIADFFANPTVRQIAAYLETMEEKEYIQIPQAEKKTEYPMSPSQRRMFAVAQMDVTSTAYNMPAAIELTGDLTEEKLNAVFEQLVKRHELLRTRFLIQSGELVQKIEESVPAKVEYFEAEFMDEEMRKAVFQEFIRPFDLSQAPLMRMKLVKMQNSKNLLLFDMHHIISDGMSMNIIQKEFMALYNGETLEEQRIQYKDYSEWLRTQDYEDQKKFWTDMFQDEIPVLELPLDYVRPQVQSFEGKTLVRMTNRKLRSKVRKLASRTGTTEYMVLLASFMVMLEKYSRQEDIVVGSPVSGRVSQDMESMLGMFVNTLSMRAKPERTKQFSSFLMEIKELCINANRNQAYSFDELVEVLDVKREMSRNPLFDVMFVLQNNERAGFGIDSLTLDGGLEAEESIAKFDLTVNIDMAEEEYRFSFEYCKALFYETSIARMMEHYMQLIEEITEHTEYTIGQLNMVTKEEEKQIQIQFNQTATRYNPQGRSVAAFFEECAELFSKKEAVRCGKEAATYGELNQKANQIAACMQEHGVKAGDFVAVLCERRIETVYAILAIVKTGAVYVPMEADYPEERIRYILEDCKPAVLLACGRPEVSRTLEVIDLEEDFSGYPSENPKVTISPEQLIYMIYTSGTTGKPKGCMIRHKSVIRLVRETEFLQCTSETVILQTGAMSFDASTLEVWGVLLNGGRLILTEKEIIMNPVLLKQTLHKEGVNTMWMTSSLFNQMLDTDEEIFDSLTYLLIGGEKLSDQHVHKLKKHNNKIHLINGYGPTENTTFTTTYEIPEEFHRIPIGTPVSNTQVYILDKEQLCGIGVPGELCAAGEGIAKGYLNDEALTNEKFVPNPFGTGCLYRTGDLARWLEDGTIEFLGRIDQQVKIRGFRIEPGEIEQVLLQQPQIENAAVVVRQNENQEKYLAAFLVGAGEVDTIRDQISRELPDYMIPAYMTFIPSIPVTANGKLDVSALPDTVLVRTKEYVKPAGEKEEILAQVCEEVLGTGEIGMKDNFFELGGDSIKAIRMISRLREHGYTLDVKTIMQERELGGIARYMVECQEEEYEQGEISGEVMLTPVQQEFFEWNMKKPEHFNQSILLKSTERIDRKAMEETLKAVVLHHDMLRAVYKDGKQVIRSGEEENLFSLELFDYRSSGDSQEKAEKECERIQSMCNLEQGPLVRAAVFRLEDGDHILITIHHLAVDGVSWRILLEDIQRAYQMYKSAGVIELPKKTASFQLWAEALQEYAVSSRVLNEMKYWKEVKEKAEAEQRIAQATSAYEPEYIEIKLNPQDTENLLYRINASYNTEVSDILLAGLVRAVAKTYGNQAVPVFMEGHGREELNQPIRIDRTVGWFTSIYPVVFDEKEDMGELIIGVKETIRRIPNHGIGYGVLKYMAKKDIEIPADITFNYLGDFREQKEESSMMEKSQLSGGSQISKENRFGTDIILNGNVSGDTLVFELTYNKAATNEEAVQALAKTYQKALLDIIGHCLSMDEEVATASDFGDTTGMSEEEWAAMEELYSDIE